MGKKNVFVHLDMNKQELQNAKAQNLTTAEITTLAGTLVAGDKGLFVYDTTLNKLFAWNGTAFDNVTPAPPQVGQYRVGVAHTDAEPANLVSGDYVIFTSAGALTNFVPGAVVQIADLAFYNGTTWDLVQGNVVQATETVAGVVQLATNAEAVAVTDSTKAITPLTLGKKVNSYKEHIRPMLANTPITVTHNLGTDFVNVRCFFGGTLPTEEIELDISYIGANQINVTSNIELPSGSMVLVQKIESETIY